MYECRVEDGRYRVIIYSAHEDNSHLALDRTFDTQEEACAFIQENT